MEAQGLALDDDGSVELAPLARASALDEARLRTLRREHFEFIWRSVRRLGVPEADADDAVQQVFIVAARKLSLITAGSERAFLFGTALRVAAHWRRTAMRRGTMVEVDEQQPDVGPSAEDLLEQRRARALLDDVLSALPLEVRAVFVLFELEELTLAEIATLLEIPSGTVASRLRRGRELFQAEVTRLKARRRKTA
jgi:RNA polymerase sigma-70 factor (ECF subfamily)